MSNVDFNLSAEVRTDLGKGASRRLRREDKVPAVIYGHNSDPLSITLDHNSLFHHLEHEAFYSHILSLTVDGKEESVVLKDLQRHPAKPIIMHADFQRVNKNEKLRMSVPIHFTGEDVAPGVKEGGLITHNITEIEISCLPGNLPEYLELDLSALELEQTAHLSDITLPEGVEIVQLSHGDDHDLPVAAVHKTRASKDADGAEGGEEAATESAE